MGSPTTHCSTEWRKSNYHARTSTKEAGPSFPQSQRFVTGPADRQKMLHVEPPSFGHKKRLLSITLLKAEDLRDVTWFSGKARLHVEVQVPTCSCTFLSRDLDWAKAGKDRKKNVRAISTDSRCALVSSSAQGAIVKENDGPAATDASSSGGKAEREPWNGGSDGSRQRLDGGRGGDQAPVVSRSARLDRAERDAKAERRQRKLRIDETFETEYRKEPVDVNILVARSGRLAVGWYMNCNLETGCALN